MAADLNLNLKKSRKSLWEKNDMLTEMTGSVLGVVVGNPSGKSVVGSSMSWGMETAAGVDAGEMTTGVGSCLESGLGLLLTILRRFCCKLCGGGVAGNFTTRVDFRLRWGGMFLRRSLCF